MPKMQITIEVWSEEGFSEIIYRNQEIFTSPHPHFRSKILSKICNFVKICLVDFNQGGRGNRRLSGTPKL